MTKYLNIYNTVSARTSTLEHDLENNATQRLYLTSAVNATADNHVALRRNVFSLTLEDIYKDTDA